MRVHARRPPSLRRRFAKMRFYQAYSMSIVDNKKAFFDYFIEERHEAGLVLEGWEVKAIRAGRSQIKEAYVVVRDAEIFLIGAHISPLLSASTHIKPDPLRTRKLLLHEEEIKKLIGKVEQKGYTLVPLNLHYTKGRVKCEIGLAKGKKLHDKRETEKNRDWQREKSQLMKTANR
jgi:SsrA-binding protein